MLFLCPVLGRIVETTRLSEKQRGVLVLPLVVRASPNVHTTPILAQLHWLPVQARISYKIACLCFSSINSSTPAYLSDILHLYSPARSLPSSADTRLLKHPLYKDKTKGDRAVCHFGPSVWNSLPPQIIIIIIIIIRDI